MATYSPGTTFLELDQILLLRTSDSRSLFYFVCFGSEENAKKDKGYATYEKGIGPK